MTATRIAAFVIGMIAGMAAAFTGSVEVHPFVIVIALLAGTGTSLWLWRRETMWMAANAAVVALCAAVTGASIGYARVGFTARQQLHNSLEAQLANIEHGNVIMLRGIICEEPEIRSDRRTDLRVRVDKISTDGSNWKKIRPDRVELRVSSGGASGAATFSAISSMRAYGDRIEFSARFNPINPPQNPGEFDLRQLLRQSDITERFNLSANNMKIIEQRRGNPLVSLALFTKERFVQSYLRTIRAPASRLVAAATLGMRRSLDGADYRGMAVTEMFRHAGVGHVLAVSGLHVSVVSLLLFTLLKTMRIPPRAFAPFLIMFLILFAILTGARPSTVRAVIMNSVILLIYAYGNRGLSGATTMGLGISAAFILLHRPQSLYSPGFVLSYGAVLSLAVITPPIDYWLGRLRGYMLALTAGWLLIMLFVAAWHGTLLLDPGFLMLATLLLAGGIKAGIFLNNLYPRAWTIGTERLPAVIRFFLCAQLAIQLGMMIPLSAWFFGRMPVAGFFVNLLAIPLVGIIVQLGLLTGIIGLLPFIGNLLTIPFGAAATVSADLFLFIAWIGTVIFPFPAFIKPSPLWMIVYYSIIILLVMLHNRRGEMAACLLAYERPAGWFAQAGIILLIAGSLTQAAIRLISPEPRLQHAWCLADSRYPAMIMRNERHGAILINGGDSFAGGFRLFDVLRSDGAMTIDQWIISSVLPGAGMEAVPPLMERFRVRKLLLPFVSSPEDFYRNLDDSFVKSRAEAGNRWAVRYGTAYEAALVAAKNHLASIRDFSSDNTANWKSMEIARWNENNSPPGRAVISANLWGFSWILITDSRPADFSDIQSVEHCDVLYLADLSNRDTYPRLQEQLARIFNPRVVILAGQADWQPDGKNTGLSPTIINTATDGAVRATISSEGILLLDTWVSGKMISLSPQNNYYQQHDN